MAGDQLYTEQWKACAGPLVGFPLAGERVYYFPQGHLEQLEPSTNDEISQPDYDLPSKILCRLINIQLKAEQGTDDVYAQITLFAEADQNEPRKYDPPLEPPSAHVQLFWKVLSHSDINPRYGLCIPRKQATECFPPLDMSQEKPAQELVAKDLNGNEWKFKHSCRGEHPRHRLTKGWSKFVSDKVLMAGDIVIFVTRGDGRDMRIGIKRLARPQRSLPSPGISDLIRVKPPAHPHGSAPSTGISSHSMHQELLAAASHAFRNKTLFTIYCKPRVSQFVVTLNKYLGAVTKKFCTGMRIKMLFEGEDSLEKRYTGTIVEVGDICQERWPNSKWRCLKIQWDGTASITIPDKVSPWEIEPFEDFVPRSLIQTGWTENCNEIPRPVVKIKKGKRKLHEGSKGQVVDVSDTLVSPHLSPRPKRASLKDLYGRRDARCPTIIGGLLESCTEEGTGEQTVLPVIQMSNSTNQGKDGSQGSLADLSNAKLFQDETQPRFQDEMHPQFQCEMQPQLQGVNNYADQLGYISSLDVQDFAFPDNTLASEGSNEAWIANLIEGVDQEGHEAEGENPTHLQPLPENECHIPLNGIIPLACQPCSSHISHISSACPIPYDGPDPGGEPVPWGIYYVARRCIPLLNRITARYPQLLSSFSVASKAFQSMSLQILAEVVYMLEHLTIGSINQEQLDDSKRHLNDLKMSGIQVDWIENRLLQIEAVFKKTMLVQRREKLILEVDSVDKQLEEVTSIMGANPLNANQSLMEGLL